MIPHSQIHWITPTSMIGGLVFGALFALCHHLFYLSLAGTAPPDSTYHIAGLHISRQEFNTAVGLTLAVLVRSSLVFAVSLSYIQIAWHTSKCGKENLTVGNMDVLLGVLGNLLNMLNAFAWWKWPLAFLAALISWLIPMATIVPPATLSFKLASPSSHLLNVPTIGFLSLDLIAEMYRDSGNSSKPIYKYNGPSTTVNSIVTAVAAQGLLLPVSPPTPNSSWTITFPGPSLSCNDVESDTKNIIETNIANYISQFVSYDKDGRVSLVRNPAPLYLAWAPPIKTNASIDLETVLSLLPFHDWNNADGIYSFVDWNFTNRSAGDLAPLFVASIPAGFNEIDTQSWSSAKDNRTFIRDTLIPTLVSDNITLLRCDLQNSTYEANFVFVNSNQNVEVTVLELDQGPFEVISSVVGLGDPLDSDSLPLGCETLYNLDSTGPIPGLTCDFDASVLSTLSYQAVLDAFTNLVRGSITMNGPASLNPTTAAGSTVLVRSPELSSIANFGGIDNSLQTLFLNNNYSNYPGLYSPQNPPSGLPLKNALEQLFQNITVSLMSSSRLQSKESSPFYPAPTNVTISTLHNVYAYSAYKLWLAYGLAIVASTAVVLTGLLAIKLNRAAFSHDFSNILRLARGAHISTDIAANDLDGKNPLPEYLSQATIKFVDTVLDMQSNDNPQYTVVLTHCLNTAK